MVQAANLTAISKDDQVKAIESYMKKQGIDGLGIDAVRIHGILDQFARQTIRSLVERNEGNRDDDLMDQQFFDFMGAVELSKQLNQKDANVKETRHYFKKNSNAVWNAVGTGENRQSAKDYLTGTGLAVTEEPSMKDFIATARRIVTEDDVPAPANDVADEMETPKKDTAPTIEPFTGETIDLGKIFGVNTEPTDKPKGNFAAQADAISVGIPEPKAKPAAAPAVELPKSDAGRQSVLGNQKPQSTGPLAGDRQPFSGILVTDACEAPQIPAKKRGRFSTALKWIAGSGVAAAGVAIAIFFGVQGKDKNDITATIENGATNPIVDVTPIGTARAGTMTEEEVLKLLDNLENPSTDDTAIFEILKDAKKIDGFDVASVTTDTVKPVETADKIAPVPGVVKNPQISGFDVASVTTDVVKPLVDTAPNTPTPVKTVSISPDTLPLDKNGKIAPHDLLPSVTDGLEQPQVDIIAVAKPVAPADIEETDEIHTVPQQPTAAWLLANAEPVGEKTVTYLSNEKGRKKIADLLANDVQIASASVESVTNTKIVTAMPKAKPAPTAAIPTPKPPVEMAAMAQDTASAADILTNGTPVGEPVVTYLSQEEGEEAIAAMIAAGKKIQTAAVTGEIHTVPENPMTQLTSTNPLDHASVTYATPAEAAKALAALAGNNLTSTMKKNFAKATAEKGKNLACYNATGAYDMAVAFSKQAVALNAQAQAVSAFQMVASLDIKNCNAVKNAAKVMVANEFMKKTYGFSAQTVADMSNNAMIAGMRQPKPTI